MTQYLWQRPEWPGFSWQSSVLLEHLVKVRFNHGRLLAYAPFIETQRGDILLIDYLEKHLMKDDLIEFFGEFRQKALKQPAPNSESLSAELKKFFAWWNDPPVGLDGMLRAGIAFFWFLVISPFEENNEEIARELCELALAQDEKISVRLYDLPSQLNAHLHFFTKVFHKSLRGDGDITEFLIFFLDFLSKALVTAETPTENALAAFTYWKNRSALPLNQRQKKFLDSLAGQPGTRITNREYVLLFKTSRESAKRDLAELFKLGLIKRNLGKGRSVSYQLAK
jgi:Fic family protein